MNGFLAPCRSNLHLVAKVGGREAIPGELGAGDSPLMVSPAALGEMTAKMQFDPPGFVKLTIKPFVFQYLQISHPESLRNFRFKP